MTRTSAQSRDLVLDLRYIAMVLSLAGVLRGTPDGRPAVLSVCFEPDLPAELQLM